MNHIKNFDKHNEQLGTIPFNTLVIVEIKTIQKVEGEWIESIEKFAGWRDSEVAPGSISVWRGGLSKSINIEEIEKFWIV